MMKGGHGHEMPQFIGHNSYLYPVFYFFHLPEYNLARTLSPEKSASGVITPAVLS